MAENIEVNTAVLVGRNSIEEHCRAVKIVSRGDGGKSKTILKGKVWWILFFLSFFFKGNLKREGLIIFKID